MEDGRIHVRFGKISAANGPPILYDVHVDEHTEWLPPAGWICCMNGVLVRDKDRPLEKEKKDRAVPCMRLAARRACGLQPRRRYMWGGRRAGGRRGRAWRTLSGQRAVHAVGSQATCRACGLQPGAACSTIAVLHVVTAYPVRQDTRHRLGWGRPQFVCGAGAPPLRLLPVV